MQQTFKKYEELTFSDNFMFNKILTNNLDVCRELIEMLLGIEIKKVELPNGEQVFDVDFNL